MTRLELTGKVVGEVRVIPRKGDSAIGVELRVAFGQPGGAGFITATLWADQAERAMQAMTQGDRVRLTGTLRWHEWVSGSDVRRSTLTMTVQDWELLPQPSADLAQEPA